MTTRAITHVYDTYDEGKAAVERLEAAGIPHSEISLVGRQHDAAVTPATSHPAATGTGVGATVGTVIGGGAGLLAGIGALAIPGVGPIVAAGWLVAAVTGAGVGAGAGGLLGSFTGAGVPERDAHVYAESVRRGATVVSVRADESRIAEVEQLLAGTGTVTLADRRARYEADGWKEYDPAAPGYTSEEIEADRTRHRTTTI